MKIKTQDLIAELKETIQEDLFQVEQMRKLPLEQLQWRAAEDKWNVLECIQHLNWYSDFYVPEMRGRMDKAAKGGSPIFKSGWLGNKFVNMLKPGARGIKTFKNKNPYGHDLEIAVLDEFINYQHETLELLDQAIQYNLNKIKTGITISNWIKLRLGDTFRVYIYHSQRHVDQAKRSRDAFSTSSASTVSP